MSVQVMVALPDQVNRRAVSLARLTSQDVPKLLADTIEISLPSVTALASVPPPCVSCPMILSWRWPTRRWNLIWTSV